jgi:hypothetical protein
MSHPAPEVIEVEGGDEDLRRLDAAGYCRVDSPKQPGEYAITARDGAPGWAGWWFWIGVCELPDKPLSSLGWKGLDK